MSKNKKTNPFDEILKRMEAAEKAEQARYEELSNKFIDEAELIIEDNHACFNDLEDVLNDITKHIEDSNLEALGAATDSVKDYIDESEARTINAVRKEYSAIVNPTESASIDVAIPRTGSSRRLVVRGSASSFE